MSMIEVKVKGTWKCREFLVSNLNVRIFDTKSRNNLAISILDVKKLAKVIEDLEELKQLEELYR